MKDDDLIICRCEEISQAEIKDVIHLGVTRMNEVKRITRAGMGLCQGKTCGRLVTGILARETDQPLKEVEPPTFRSPTRVLPLGVLASDKPGED